jgi:hypothetical protein
VLAPGGLLNGAERIVTPPDAEMPVRDDPTVTLGGTNGT